MFSRRCDHVTSDGASCVCLLQGSVKKVNRLSLRVIFNRLGKISSTGCASLSAVSRIPIFQFRRLRAGRKVMLIFCVVSVTFHSHRPLFLFSVVYSKKEAFFRVGAATLTCVESPLDTACLISQGSLITFRT